MGSSRERRQFERVNRSFITTCTTDENLTIKVSADCKDISEQGVKIVSSRELIPKRNIYLGFHLPESGVKLELLSEVIWVSPSKIKRNTFEAGIKFHLLHDNQVSLLRNFITSCLQTDA